MNSPAQAVLSLCMIGIATSLTFLGAVLIDWAIRTYIGEQRRSIAALEDILAIPAAQPPSLEEILAFGPPLSSPQIEALGWQDAPAALQGERVA